MVSNSYHHDYIVKMSLLLNVYLYFEFLTKLHLNLINHEHYVRGSSSLVFFMDR
jgi:hypothetical protein